MALDAFGAPWSRVDSGVLNIKRVTLEPPQWFPSPDRGPFRLTCLRKQMQNIKIRGFWQGLQWDDVQLIPLSQYAVAIRLGVMQGLLLRRCPGHSHDKPVLSRVSLVSLLASKDMESMIAIRWETPLAQQCGTDPPITVLFGCRCCRPDRRGLQPDH